MFACIRDCRVCPFACGRNSAQPVQQAQSVELPQSMVKQETAVPEPVEEIKPETETVIQTTLPAVQEMQYELKESKKAGFFDKIKRV